MKTSQFYSLLAVIYIANYADETTCLVMSIIFCVLALLTYKK